MKPVKITQEDIDELIEFTENFDDAPDVILEIESDAG